MIKAYNLTLYPLTLFVAISKDTESLLKKFDFYDLIPNMDGEPSVVRDGGFERGYASTWLVSDKRTRERGVLIVLNTDDLGITSTLMNSAAHEAVHAADAIWQFIGSDTQNYDEGNEPYAYLVGYITGRVAEYIIKYGKND